MSVDVEWLKDHVSAPYTLLLLEHYVGMVNLRPGAAVGESGGPLVEKGGESDVESWHLQGCAPACVS
jgi:hypothetical protein